MGLCGDRLWCALSPSLLWYGPPPSLRCGVGLGLVVGCLLVFWVPWRTFGITVIDCVPRSHAPVPQVDGRYIVGLRCMLGVLDIPAPSVHARSFGHPGLFRVRSKDVSAQSWATVRGTMARDLDGNETPCLKIYVSHSAVGPRYTFEDPISC